MKTILFLILAACSGAVWAQANLALPKDAATAKTVITSDSATFDNNTQQQVFLGNVVVVDPRCIVTACW
jgi:lipopolysaccharide export system protein LptA